MQTSEHDPAFEIWLQALPGLGYPRLWIGNNIEALRKRYRDTQGAAMPQCPEPSRPAYDPYRGL